MTIPGLVMCSVHVRQLGRIAQIRAAVRKATCVTKRTRRMRSAEGDAQIQVGVAAQMPVEFSLPLTLP